MDAETMYKIDRLNNLIKILQADNKELGKYINHKDDCGKGRYGILQSAGRYSHCTCGLDNLLKKHKPSKGKLFGGFHICYKCRQPIKNGDDCKCDNVIFSDDL